MNWAFSKKLVKATAKPSYNIFLLNVSHAVILTAASLEIIISHGS